MKHLVSCDFVWKVATFISRKVQNENVDFFVRIGLHTIVSI